VKLTENINALKINVTSSQGTINKPFIGGALLSSDMRMIENLGTVFTNDFKNRKRPCAIYECPYCGKYFKVQISLAKSGRTLSCGCVISRRVSHTTHNMTHTKLYRVYAGMKERCYYTKHVAYSGYGGRGITVCDEWKNDFMVFYNWAMSNGYKKGLRIDRRDNNGNYCPENCRWVTKEGNAQNTRMRKYNTSGFRGVFKSGNNWVAKISVHNKQMYLGYFNVRSDAAKAYDKAAIKYHGEFACLNFPEFDYISE